MSKIPPRRRKTAYSSLRRICRKLNLRVTTGRKAYRLDDLLRGMTSENRVGEIDSGPPVGRELI